LVKNSLIKNAWRKVMVLLGSFVSRVKPTPPGKDHWPLEGYIIREYNDSNKIICYDVESKGQWYGFSERELVKYYDIIAPSIVSVLGVRMYSDNYVCSGNELVKVDA